VIPEFESFCETVTELYQKQKTNMDGQVSLAPLQSAKRQTDKWQLAKINGIDTQRAQGMFEGVCGFGLISHTWNFLVFKDAVKQHQCRDVTAIIKRVELSCQYIYHNIFD